MIAAAHRMHKVGDGPDCKVCRRPSRAQKRKEWGCDEPGGLVFSSSCPRCRGYTEDCEVCRGSMVKTWDRCPASQSNAWAMRIAETYENLAQGHGWPNGETWAEQDNREYLAVQVYANEVGLIREAQNELRRKEAQMGGK